MKTEKAFDAVALMRSLREQLAAELESVPPEERIAYINRRGEAFARERGFPPAVDPREAARRAREARREG